jgi:hypothetical protein
MRNCIHEMVKFFTHTTLGRSTKLDGVVVSGFLRLSNPIRKDLIPGPSNCDSRAIETKPLARH